MSKTKGNFVLSKTSKMMMATFVDPHQRADFKKAMIDAEYSASIIIKSSKKDKFVTGTPAAE